MYFNVLRISNFIAKPSSVKYLVYILDYGTKKLEHK